MSQTFMTKPSFVRFNILVVDDDFTSLSIVSAMLKRWDYDVVTVRRPVEALATIRIQQDIDLVVTDLHMPEMNGLQLQKQINEEFNNLPVIVMSSDDRESVIMKALASGVVFYIVKPLNPVDLKNVWQYAVTSKKGKSIYIPTSFEGVGSSSDDKLSFDEIVSSSSVNEQKKNKKDSKRKALKNGKGGEQGESVISAPKKAKVAWTNSLHNRFLQAIRHISLEKAVPKKILEFMNVPGLTRENVASHLQKYRIFLKRVAERGAGVASKNFTHRSSFAAAHSAMMLQEAQEYAQIREKQQKQKQQMMRGYGGGISSLNGTINASSLGFPSLGDSSSNSVSQLGLLGNQAYNFHQSLFGNTTNPLYQQNPSTTFGTGSNDFGSNSLSCGASSFKDFGTPGWNPSYGSGLQNIVTVNNNPYSSYAGIQLNGYGLINGTAGDEGVTTGLMGNATVHHLAPGDSFSSSAAFANGNEQDNTPLLPPLSSLQQHGLSNNAQNDFTNLGNIAQPEQFGEDIDFGNFLFDQSEYQILFQQQGRESALSPNSVSGSVTNQAQLNLPTSQSQNPDLSGAFAVGDNNDPNSWNEPTLEQLREIEQILNQELSSNEYYPGYDQNPNQLLQQRNQNNLNNSDDELSPSGNQGWYDEFFDSLFRNDP